MKYALVTGASGDIGRATAIALARAGHYIYVHANQQLGAAQRVEEHLAKWEAETWRKRKGTLKSTVGLTPCR